MEFHLGCAVWSYPEWVGSFYPAKSRSRDFLRLYGQRFTTVEGNTTFYAIPDRATLHRWATATPSGFEFCLKLPRAFSHQGLLLPHLAAACAFLASTPTLGDRLGPTFIQLPPNYGPDRWDDLTAFLQGMTAIGVPLALEVRHRDWFIDAHGNRLNGFLRDLGIGRVLLDSRPIYDCPDNPQLHSERRKPQLPLQPVLTAPFTLIRLISHPTADWNQPYLAAWVNQVATWLQQGTRIYFFVHCPQEAQSPHTARQFQHALERQGIPVPPLPWDQLVPEPSQLTLF
ncbi:DUF72 domain-containing protein [Trichothermofontia sp.]